MTLRGLGEERRFLFPLLPRPHLLFSPILAVCIPEWYPAREEREGNSLLHNDNAVATGRTQGWDGDRKKESLKSHDVFRAGSEGALSLWFPPWPPAPRLSLDAQGHTHPQERDVGAIARGRGRVLWRVLEDEQRWWLLAFSWGRETQNPKGPSVGAPHIMCSLRPRKESGAWGGGRGESRFAASLK